MMVADNIDHALYGDRGLPWLIVKSTIPITEITM